jgi:hypothetical protein
VDLYYSGPPSPTRLFSYLALKDDPEVMVERVVDLAHMRFWGYLNQKICGVKEESVLIDEIVDEVRRYPLPIKQRALKRGIEKVALELERMEGLCARAERLSLELHSGTRFKGGKRRREILRTLSLIDEKIASFGRLGRIISFLGLLNHTRNPAKEKDIRITEDTLIGYHMKKEACFFMHRTLEEVAKRL